MKHTDITSTQEQPQSLPQINFDSPWVQMGSDILLVVGAISLVALRRSLSQLKDKILNSKEEPSYSIAPDKALDDTINYWLHQLMNTVGCDAVLLGIAHNGQFSEYGFHFQKAAWDYQAAKPGYFLVPPSQPVSTLSANAKTVWQPIDYSKPGHHFYRGLFLGNLLVAFIIIYDLEDKDINGPNEDIVPVIKGLQVAITESLRPQFK